MEVYKVIAKTMHDEGVTDVFGLMGHGNMDILTEMVRTYGVNYYKVRQENAAVAAATGYALVSGRVGVATTNHGPGFTNAVTALTNAVKAHAPVVFFVDEPVTRGGGHNTQAIDHKAVVLATGAGFEYVRYPEDAGYQTAKAFRRAKAERRPIVLHFPVELFREEGKPSPTTYGDRVTIPRLAPDPESIRKAADLIEKAEKPVILGGLGAWHSGARPVLEQLGDRLGALMTNALRAKGFFNGHPYDIGTSGGFASHLAQRLMPQADCVIGFGAAMKRLTLYRYNPDAVFIHCDVDERVFDTFWPTQHWIHGDARLAAEMLLEELDRRGVRKQGFRTPELAEEIANYTRASEYEDQSTDNTIDPRTAMLKLDPALPAERTMVVDSGVFQGWPPMFMNVPDPEGFIFAHDFGVVGLGIGHGIGAYAARPERRPVVMIGDGGFMMSMQEFETAVRHRVPLVVVVMNDHAYGAEVMVLKRQGTPPDLAYFDNPDLAEVARALGGEGWNIHRPEDIAPTAQEALKVTDRPVLLNIHINGEVVPEWLEKFTFLESLHP